MFTISIDLSQVALYLLVLCRTAGVMSVAPLLGSGRLPGRAKAALAMTVAAVLTPVAGPPPECESPVEMVLAASGEILVGLAIGFAARLLFAAVQMAGELADLQSAFGFAAVVSPQTGERTAVIGQLQMSVAWLIFLGANGHHLVLRGLGASLSAVPLGGGTILCAPTLTQATAGTIAAAVSMAAPVVGAVMLADFALGLLTRAAPQMNLLAIGFPIKLGVGLLATLLALPLLVSAERGLLLMVESVIRSMLIAMGG